MKSVNNLFMFVATVCILVMSLQVSAEVDKQIITNITRVEVVSDGYQVFEVDFTHGYNAYCNDVAAYPSVSIISKPKHSGNGELLEQGLIRISIYEKIVQRLDSSCFDLPAPPQTMTIYMEPMSDDFSVINMLSSSSDIDVSDIFRSKYKFELPKVFLRP